MRRYLRLNARLPSVKLVPSDCELPDNEGIEQSANVGFVEDTCAKEMAGASMEIAKIMKDKRRM